LIAANKFDKLILFTLMTVQFSAHNRWAQCSIHNKKPSCR